MTEAPAGCAHLVKLTDVWSLWQVAGLRGAGLPFGHLDAFAGYLDPPEAEAEPQNALLRERSAAAVRAMLAEPAFLEAVTWQNTSLVHNWLGAYAEQVRDGKDVPLARRDQREALVAFLAQRYCAKNETIGFFGPVAWARFVAEDCGLVVRGEGGLADRTLYVETWAVAGVADRLAADPRLAEHLLARRHPVCAARDGILLRPRREPARLTGDGALLFDELASPSRVGELLDRCAAKGRDRAGLAATLRELTEDDVLLVGWPIPVQERPELRLRALVDGITDPPLRAELAGRLDGFDAALDAVRDAAGQPTELLRALDQLDAEFAALTGQAGRRDKPDRRFGRAVVYEDCRRDLTASIGADLLADLRAPLGLLLDSGRWLAAELGREVEQDLLARHGELAARRAHPVSLADLVVASGDILNGLPGTAVHRVAEDFQARWAELLATADETGRLHTATLRPLATALFAPAEVGWRAARQHSPDLMLATPQGERPRWVLGELHLSLNTLENRPFLTQATDRAELLAATEADYPTGRIVPVYPPDAPEVTSRTYPPPAMDLPDRYHYWSYARDAGHPLVDDPLPGAGLLLEPDGDRLLVRLPDGTSASALEFLGEFLTALAVDRFQLRGPARHRGRLLLDEVVIARESWQLPVGEVPLPPASGADYGHRELRSWLADLGTPRWLFARTPRQPKPWLVDRQAPLSLRNLARSVRKLAEDDPDGTLTLVEMLPSPDQLWLADADGRYTSELRVVAVDDWQPAEPVVSA